ncbi:MAG: GNAT family N-acetyltransferase [Candidatus Binatia bacterium]
MVLPFTVLTRMEIRRVIDIADRDAAYAVRRAVFQGEQGVPAEIEFDADDERAVHMIAADQGTVVGTGRVVLQPDYAKIGRMAVLPGWRQRGVGRALLDALLQEAARRGAPRAVLHAQVQAIGFYARAGFTAVGDEFDEAGIAHRRMEQPL